MPDFGDGRIGFLYGPRCGETAPRDVHQSHLDQLKAMMTNGVPYGPTYHAGGHGTYCDGYHFKDTGHLHVSPHTHDRIKRDPRVIYLNTSKYGPNSWTRYDGIGYRVSKRP